jgi:FHA domain
MTTTREEKTRVSEISRIADKRLAGGIPCFVQIYGKDIGRKYPLDKVQTTIGRGPDNHIVCDMDNVSRNHCKIFAGAGGSWIEDMGSTNGTFVNDGELGSRRKLMLAASSSSTSMATTSNNCIMKRFTAWPSLMV